MKYKLNDLIDIPLLQDLLDSLNAAFPISISIRELDGTLLMSTGWRDVCIKFHNMHPAVAKKCTDNNQYSLKDFHNCSKPMIRICHMGLTDCVMPLIVREKHVGNILFGQFFKDKPDAEFFRKQARQFGFNEDVYLDALAKVPILNIGQLDNIQDVIRKLIELFAEMGQKRLQEKKIENDLQQSENKFNQLFESTPLPIYVIDEEGEIVIYNKAMAKIIGASSREEFIWQKTSSISPEYQPDGQLSTLKGKSVVDEAFRHGIELPEYREANGKPRTGTVHLSAVQSGGNVIVKITDDGAGMPRLYSGI